MTDGKIGYGATLAVGNRPATTQTTWEVLAQVGDIEGPGEKVDSVDITNQGSPNRNMEFIPGMNDPGEVKVTCVYSADAYLDAVAIKGAEKAFKLTTPWGNSAKFDGFVTEVSAKYPVKDKAAFDVTIKATGEVVHQAAA